MPDAKADRHKTQPKAVRMPDGLPARVKAAADSDGVTVNSFIVAAIEEKLDRCGSGSTTLARSGATTPRRARKPSTDTAPAATFRPARAHALTCKCGICKTHTKGDRQ